MSDVIFTGKHVAKLMRKLDLGHKEMAEQLGCSSKTISNYLKGSNIRDDKIIKILGRLWREHFSDKESTQSTYVAPVDEFDFSGKKLKKLRVKLGLTLEQMAEKIGLPHGTQWSVWENDRGRPTKPEYRQAIVQAWGEAFPAVDGEGITTEKPRHKVAPAIIHEMATKFYLERQTEMNRELVKHAFSFVQQETNIDSSMLRKALTLFLTLLKDRLAMEDIYVYLTGYKN